MKNTTIALDRNSQIRIDARNTLKYTLLLDYNFPTIQDDAKLIPVLFRQCHNCCSKIMKESNIEEINKTSESLPTNISYDFFGWKRNSYNTTDPQLHVMILNHCLISSYHAILTELTKGSYVSSYAITNKIQTRGLRQLINNNIVSLNTTPWHINQKSNTSTRSSAKASDFSNSVNTHWKTIQFLTSSSEQSNDKCPQFLLQFSNLIYAICKSNASLFLKKTACSHPREIIKWLQNLRRNLYSYFSEANNVDKLYAQYLIERSFNINLIYSLLRNIYLAEEKTNFQFRTDYILNILCLCKDLPNVFSRQCFMQYAFDAIDSNTNSYQDFWANQEKIENDIMMSFDRKHQMGFQFNKWIEQYQLFMNYMSLFVIPLYEWCFLDMLLSSIENKYIQNSHYENLQKAFDLLATYINNNSDDIVHPSYPNTSSNSDTLFITNNLSHIKTIENLSKNTVFKIYHELYAPEENDIELNIATNLNPDFFKNIPDTNGLAKRASNPPRIHAFYNNLIHYDYLI